MELQLYQEIVLSRDLVNTPYKKGDLATIIDIYDVDNRTYFSLEFYNSHGETLNTEQVVETDIHPIPKNTIVCIRNLS